MIGSTCLRAAAFAALCACAAGAAAAPPPETFRPPGYQPQRGDARLGEKLFGDTRLSTNGSSCESCHAGGAAFSAAFAQPYPHQPASARAGFGGEPVYLDEEVQRCMVGPMAARPLPWNSAELAGLTAYLRQLQANFQPDP